MDYTALTLDEREQYAIEPIDYSDYNMRIPLSPTVTSRSFDYNDPDYDDDEIMKNERRYINDYDDFPTAFSIRRAVQRWNRYRRDHPRACGGRLTPVPEQPFDLMGLSPEVRRLIFRYLFRGQLLHSQGVIIHMGDDNSAGVDGDEKEPYDVRVFTVSKLIKQEAMQVFFEDNTFRVEVADDARDCRESEDMQPLSVFLRPRIDFWPMESLRRFDIVMSLDDEDDLRYLSSVAHR